jgi:rhodanese-related sulfurtransferase
MEEIKLNMKKIFYILLASLLLVTGCQKQQSELDKIVNENNYVIVDVRTKDEYDTGHVKDSLNIPVDSIDQNVELDKNKTIIVSCRSGRRSATAKQKLENLGYKVYDLGAYESITKFEKGA